MGTVHVTYYTDPARPWSSAAEPGLRRLRSEFGTTRRITYVMGGLAPEFRKPVETMHHVPDARAARRPPREAGRSTAAAEWRVRIDRELTGQLRRVA